MDFGLKTFLALSGNAAINSPLFYLKSLKELKIKQRKLSLKKKGSSNRLKAKFPIKLANKRKDYLYKLASYLAKKYDNVFIEDLNIKAMAKIWGRKVNGLAFNELMSILASKTNKFYPSSKACKTKRKNIGLS